MLTDGGDENYGGMFFSSQADVNALDDDVAFAHAMQNSLDLVPVYAPEPSPPYNHQAIPMDFPAFPAPSAPPAPSSPPLFVPVPPPNMQPYMPVPPSNRPFYIPVPPPNPDKIARDQRKKDKEEALDKRLKDKEDALDKRLKDREDADERRRQANEARSNSITRNIIFRDYDYDRENRLRLLALGLIPDFPYISKTSLEEKVNELIKKELKKDTTAVKPSTDEEMVKLIKVAIDSANPKKASKPKKKSSKKKSSKKKSSKSSKKKSKKKV